jgi:hypothetical protein
MGLMDGTMSSGNDMAADRMQMLMQKMNDGTITDSERDELAKMQGNDKDTKM